VALEEDKAEAAAAAYLEPVPVVLDILVPLPAALLTPAALEANSGTF
jgi:hypothetical protein